MKEFEVEKQGIEDLLKELIYNFKEMQSEQARTNELLEEISYRLTMPRPTKKDLKEDQGLLEEQQHEIYWENKEALAAQVKNRSIIWEHQKRLFQFPSALKAKATILEWLRADNLIPPAKKEE